MNKLNVSADIRYINKPKTEAMFNYSIFDRSSVFGKVSKHTGTDLLQEDKASIAKMIGELMEDKKVKKASFLERTNLFRSVGLLLSMTIVSVMINWKSYEQPELVDLTSNQVATEEILDIPLTEQPPPPPPQQMQQLNILEVPDEQEIIEDIEINIDIEMSEDLIVEQVEAPMIEEEEEEDADEIFMVVENKPEPYGGFQKFYAFVAENLEYPNRALKNQVSGKVFLQFVVDKDGSLTDIQVVKGIGSGCDEEAVRVLKLSPKWKPGKQRGRNVKVRMVVPINFVFKER